MTRDEAYAVLNINPNSIHTLEDIQKAFQELCPIYDPLKVQQKIEYRVLRETIGLDADRKERAQIDIGREKTRMTEKFKDLREAYVYFQKNPPIDTGTAQPFFTKSFEDSFDEWLFEEVLVVRQYRRKHGLPISDSFNPNDDAVAKQEFITYTRRLRAIDQLKAAKKKAEAGEASSGDIATALSCGLLALKIQLAGEERKEETLPQSISFSFWDVAKDKLKTSPLWVLALTSVVGIPFFLAAVFREQKMLETKVCEHLRTQNLTAEREAIKTVVEGNVEQLVHHKAHIGFTVKYSAANFVISYEDEACCHKRKPKQS